MTQGRDVLSVEFVTPETTLACFDKKKRKRERMKEREREKLLKICGNYGNIYKMSWPTFPFTDKFANQLKPLRNQPYSSSFHINHQAYPF